MFWALCSNASIIQKKLFWNTDSKTQRRIQFTPFAFQAITRHKIKVVNNLDHVMRFTFILAIACLHGNDFIYYQLKKSSTVYSVIDETSRKLCTQRLLRLWIFSSYEVSLFFGLHLESLLISSVFIFKELGSKQSNLWSETHQCLSFYFFPLSLRSLNRSLLGGFPYWFFTVTMFSLILLSERSLLFHM